MRLGEELMRLGVQQSASDGPAGSEASWGGYRREAAYGKHKEQRRMEGRDKRLLNAISSVNESYVCESSNFSSGMERGIPDCDLWGNSEGRYGGSCAPSDW